MKTKLMTLTVVFTLGVCAAFGTEKTDKIVIKGNCTMCEKRIESAANEVNGVTKVDWDKTTKKLKVVYDDTKTSADNIEVAVAKIGHDTPNHKASDDVYNELPDCCKYRDKAKTH